MKLARPGSPLPVGPPQKPGQDALKQPSRDAGKQIAARKRNQNAPFTFPPSIARPWSQMRTWVTDRQGSKRSPLAPTGGESRGVPTLRECSDPNSLFSWCFLRPQSPGRAMEIATEVAPGAHKSQNSRKDLLLWIGQLWFRDRRRTPFIFVFFLFSPVAWRWTWSSCRGA